MTSVSTSGAATAPQRGAARAVGLLALAVFVSALAGAWRGSELAATWFYCAAWWSYIFLVDAWIYRRRGSSILFTHTRAFVLLALWSAAFWLVFEVLNFRLQNWYYVGVPREEPTRSLGIFISFATVLPGIFETGDLLATLGAFERRGCAPWKIPRRAGAWLYLSGAACLVLPLCFPRYAFALTWGATFFLCEAWLLGRGSGGVLAELARGRSGIVWRWLAAGLVCGLLWETWNSLARARWIYSVPFFEDAKLFEMPLAGFLGFPPFALECYSFARVLVAARLLPDWERAPGAADRSAPSARRAWLGALAAILFALPAIAGVNALTVRATRPMLDEIPGLSAETIRNCERAGIRTTDELLRAAAEGPLDRLWAAADAARRAEILATARLMQVRGLGARGVRALAEAGVATVDDLARSDPELLYRRLSGSALAPTPRLTAAEVRVWVRGARLEH